MATRKLSGAAAASHAKATGHKAGTRKKSTSAKTVHIHVHTGAGNKKK